MIIGQTMFSVRRGTQHRAGAALKSSDGCCRDARGSRASGSCVPRHVAAGERLATKAVRRSQRPPPNLVQTEWEASMAHDRFFSAMVCSRCFGLLSSGPTSGPYDVPISR